MYHHHTTLGTMLCLRLSFLQKHVKVKQRQVFAYSYKIHNNSASDQALNILQKAKTFPVLKPICCSLHHPDELLSINFSITCTFQVTTLGLEK